MKGNRIGRTEGALRGGLAAAILLVQGSVLQIQATLYTLTDQASTATYDSLTGNLSNWTIDGQSQLNIQNFWYRTTPGSDTALINLGTPAVVQSSLNLLSATYANSQLSVTVSYWLTGSPSGNGAADVNEQITVRNLTGAQQTYHFFQYSDFDLGGLPTGDTAILGTDSTTGKFVSASQTKQNINLTTTTQNSVITPQADAGEVDLVSPGGGTLSRLTGQYDLNDNAGPTTGDVSWALEWGITLNGGKQQLLSEDNAISGVTVPEPGSLTLLGLGLAGWLIRRRLA